jgi:prepilin-type N-terminal cleavage/methylation domain-containing protein
VKRGFTLIELLVVIAIIAILAAILFPVFASAKESAKKTTCIANLRNAGMSMAMYLADYDDAYPNTGDPYLWVGKRFRWPIMPYLGIGQRQESGSFDTDRNKGMILTCPSDHEAETQYDGTSYAYSAAFYHTSDQLSGMTLRNLIPGLNDPGTGAQTTSRTSTSVASPSTKGLIVEWLNSHKHDGKAVGFWGTIQPGLLPGEDRWTGARTLLFADLHAKFTAAGQQTPSVDDCPDINLTPGGILGSDLR